MRLSGAPGISRLFYYFSSNNVMYVIGDNTVPAFPMGITIHLNSSIVWCHILYWLGYYGYILLSGSAMSFKQIW